MEISKESSLAELRIAINSELSQFIEVENGYLRNIGSELDPVADSLERFLLESGKRLRPLFALVGFLGSGASLTPQTLAAASSLELIHVCALIHDDVMDGSDTRRGAPSIHRTFEKMHRTNSLQGSAEQFGISSAILLGDLALIWSAKMLHQSGISANALVGSLPMYDEMRVELMAGQYLDVFEQALASQSVERSLRVARFKSGKYTIERPLHFGAALSGNSNPELIQRYSEYGLPLGEAFQLRDDILGVFGDPLETGKPAGDDLREGKRTVLMATTLERADESQRAKIAQLFGDKDLAHDGIDAIRTIITETGALDSVERLIDTLTTAAQQALSHPEISAVGQKHMHDLIAIAIARTV